MYERCPSCGHDLGALGGHPGHAGSALIPDIGTSIGTDPRSNAATEVTSTPDKKSRAPWVVALLCVGVAAAVLIGLLGGASSTDSATEEAQQPQDGLPADASDADQVGGVGGAAVDGSDAVTGDSPSGDANFPPSDDHLAADRVADLFELQVDGDQQYAVIYPSQMGLQILSADGIVVPDLEVAVGFNEAARFPLLSDGNTTWAINPDSRDIVFLVSTQFEVVDIGVEGSVAFINPSIEPTNVGISSFGAWGPGFDVPPGSEILGVPGRGLLIVPPTGGTYKLKSTGVEKVRDDRVVAAGLRSEVYERCDRLLQCELYVTGTDNDVGVVLDIEVGSPVFVSPLGEHVLAIDEESAHIVTIATGERWDVTSDPVEGVGWSPDGRFVAFTSGDDLVLAFADEQRIEQTTLPILPASSHLLVVAS